MGWLREKAKVSMLSVAPGWGMVGNPPTADYLYVNQYVQGQQYLGQASTMSTGLKLTNLRWETVTTWNLGFNLGFFDDRLKIVDELYRRDTRDMLMANAAIPSSNGWSGLSFHNVGDMRNQGWELQVMGDRLMKRGKFWADVYVNFADNNNVITRMDPYILKTLNIDWSENNRSLVQRVQINNPFGSIYGFRYKGVYQYDKYQEDNPAATARYRPRHGAAGCQERHEHVAGCPRCRQDVPYRAERRGTLRARCQRRPRAGTFLLQDGNQ